jgi:hypothetical protein
MLPSDLDPEELNEMIRDLGRELGCPDGIYPDLIRPDPDNHSYWGQGNEERHRESAVWRRKLIKELGTRPKWIAQWWAEVALDQRIRALCEAKGMSFQPHELAPWEVPAEGEPDHTYPPGHGVRKQWPIAQRLRRELEAELAAEDGR